MLKEFSKFLKEFNVISLAVGFVMGTASTALINSLVKDILMPLVQPLLSGDGWRNAILKIGPVSLAYGSFLAELLNFLILAFIIFFVVKKLLNMEIKLKK